MTDSKDDSSSSQDPSKSAIFELAKAIATDPQSVQSHLDEQSKKYGERYQQSALIEDDTSETYRNRLVQLYPEPEQVAYIDAIFDIDRIIEFRFAAFESCSKGIPPQGEIGDMFPTALNQGLLNVDMKEIHKKEINLSPQTANSMVRSCNLAIWGIEKVETQHTQPLKNSLLGYVKGIEKIDDNPRKDLLLRYTRRLAKKGIDSRTHENILRGEVNNLVNPLDVDLLTSFSIDSFKKIKEIIAKPLDFYEIYLEGIRTKLALDSCGIGIKDSSDIAKSIRRDIERSSNN